jgi:hypothetical protein
MEILKRRRWPLVLGVVGLGAVAVSAALAATTIGGGGVARVKVVYELNPQSTSSTTFVDMAGATTKIVVPRRTRALLLARFTGESLCDGGPAGAVCTARIVIGNAEGNPAAAADFAFDSNGTGADFAAAQAMERARAVGPGTYTVKVQWAVSDAGTTFTLDDWTLVVERVRR